MLPFTRLGLTNFRLLTSSNVATQIPICGVKSRTLEERLGIPTKPKKPLTPYFRYMQEVRPSLVISNPKANIADIVRLVAKQWETVDLDKKKKLETEYKKDQIAYIEKRTIYESKLTDEQKRNLKQLKEDIVESKEKRTLKKKIKDLGKPKRPGSAFIKFLVLERTVTPQGSLTYKEWHKNVTEKWKKLSNVEKEKFLSSTKSELVTYKQELSKWEEKMVRLGNIDVVRHEALIESPPVKPKRKSQE